MQVTVDRKILFSLLDLLLARWQAKQFPYDKKDAVIPQTIVPEKLRDNKTTLACFYFFACIYMRGGIESLQAFNALIAMWRTHPHLFDPLQAQWMGQLEMQSILKEYIGWDSRAASINWIENSRRLAQFWKSNPLNLLRKLRSYEEALRRIRNKLTQRERASAGEDGLGFRGFQPKMVSMLLYFYDWEGWLEKRFLYPTPADFHNFRMGFNQGAIVLSTPTDVIRITEKISKPWRDTLMEYLRTRKADPIEVADALWLFSLVMCGNSPLTRSKENINGSGMFAVEDLPHSTDIATFSAPQFRNALLNSCLRCPVRETCRLAIPSQPYYRRGQFVLRARPQVEKYMGDVALGVPLQKIKPTDAQMSFLPLLSGPDD